MASVIIEKLAYGGSGFGKIDGKACFVPFTAPGDQVEIEITKCTSSYTQGRTTKLTTPSAYRVSPQCNRFGSCGGCNWQHIDYDEQCRQKSHLLAESLWRSARLDAASIRPLIRATSPYHYRQRIQLKVHYSGGRLSVGFYRTGSHYVIDLPDGCPIATSAINAAIAEVRKVVLRSGEPERIPQVDLAASPSGLVLAVVHYLGNDRNGLQNRLAPLCAELATIQGISVQQGRKNTLEPVYGPEQITYRLPSSMGNELELAYSPECFSQVNFDVNRAIVSEIVGLCREIACGKVLDLFCGNGNFSLPLARSASKVVGIESFEKSVGFANGNARHNRIEHASYLCLDAATGLEQLAVAGETYDLLLIDPPRSGAVEVVSRIHPSLVSSLLYVSCDPPTLARDLNLLRKNGFQVKFVQPFDMFPQTYHLESMTFLQA